MISIDLKQLEDCLNCVAMDDLHEGYRPTHSAAQLYYGRNDITNEELTQIEAALDEIVDNDDLDRRIDVSCKYYRSQKFGSRRDAYLAALERRAAEAEALATAAERLETLYAEDVKPGTFFDKDYAWFSEALT